MVVAPNFSLDMPGKKPNNNNKPTISKSKKKRAKKKAKAQQAVNGAAMAHASMHIGKRINAGATREEKLLAMAMGLPNEVGALRFPTKDAPRTAVMSALDQRTITASNSTLSPWTAGDVLVAFYGQPGRLAMVYASITSPSYYPLLFSGPSGQSSNWTLSTDVIAGSIEPNSVWPLVATDTFTSGAYIHGKTMAVGMSAGVGYLWMNVNDAIGVVSAAGTSNLVGTAVFEIHQWVGRDTEVQVKQVNLTLSGGLVPAGNLFIASSNGYYAVHFMGYLVTSGSTTTATSVTLRLTCNATTGWTQVSMGDLDVNANGDPSIGEEVRVNACSMLLTNTTSILNRQGTVLAARVRANDFTSMSPAILAKVAEKYTGDAALGVYTFKEFSDYAEKFQNVVITDSSKGLVYDLDMDDYFHFVQITCPNVATAANTFTLSFSTILEFKTDVARYAKDVSPLNEANLIAARKLINSRPEWFYENPLHASQIYDFIRNLGAKALRGAAYVAPAAAKVASMYNPAGAPGYEMLAQMLRGMVLR